MMSDATITPSKTEIEIITDFNERISGNGAKFFHNYSVVTSKHEYDIRKEMFLKMQVGEPIKISRSVLTNAKQKIDHEYNGVIYSENLGFARETIGLIFLGIMILLTISVMIFYNRIRYELVKWNVTMFIVICVVAFLYFHFR